MHDVGRAGVRFCVIFRATVVRRLSRCFNLSAHIEMTPGFALGETAIPCGRAKATQRRTDCGKTVALGNVEGAFPGRRSIGKQCAPGLKSCVSEIGEDAAQSWVDDVSLGSPEVIIVVPAPALRVSVRRIPGPRSRKAEITFREHEIETAIGAGVELSDRPAASCAEALVSRRPGAAIRPGCVCPARGPEAAVPVRDGGHHPVPVQPIHVPPPRRSRPPMIPGQYSAGAGPSCGAVILVAVGADQHPSGPSER